ncbi:MAG: M3 family oligoendopeptidase [Promethearchaeia archaeon]
MFCYSLDSFDKRAFPLKFLGFQGFLRMKAKAVGVKKLPGYDVIAPWVTEPVWTFDWPKAKSMVIDSFESFDDDLGSVVQSMFEDRRIDSENRVGKMNTAFCSSWPSASKSFVFLNYNKTLNDIYTLAHENGHAAQGHLIYENQTPVNYSMSMCMAETGSIFGELLLIERILSMADTEKERYEILSHVLNSYYYTVYYVGVRAFFEKSLYNAIDNGEVIDADLACELWNEAKERIFGDVVDWTDYMEYEWARIPHFFFSNYRYYNYPYSFAQMLVFAVYGDYQKGEPDFNSRFKQLLAAGGSKSPKQQIADFGYDLNKPEFWKLGSSQANRLLKQLDEVL